MSKLILFSAILLSVLYISIHASPVPDPSDDLEVAETHYGKGKYGGGGYGGHGGYAVVQPVYVVPVYVKGGHGGGKYGGGGYGGYGGRGRKGHKKHYG